MATQHVRNCGRKQLNIVTRGTLPTRHNSVGECGKFSSLRLGRPPSGLLERAHVRERLLAHDISDRSETTVLAVHTGRLAPTLRAHAQLLSQQGQEDLGLLLAESW